MDWLFVDTMSDNLLLDTLCVNEKNEDGEGIVYSDKISLHLSEFTGYILIQSKHQYRSDGSTSIQ